MPGCIGFVSLFSSCSRWIERWTQIQGRCGFVKVCPNPTPWYLLFEGVDLQILTISVIPRRIVCTRFSTNSATNDINRADRVWPCYRGSRCKRRVGPQESLKDPSMAEFQESSPRVYFIVSRRRILPMSSVLWMLRVLHGIFEDACVYHAGS